MRKIVLALSCLLALGASACGSAGGGVRIVRDLASPGDGGVVPLVDLSGPAADLSMTAATCSDAVKNGAETDVDCGGGMCNRCVNGKRCVAPSDCQSARCNAGTCEAASCNDGALDQDETDVDCGGTHCGPCADNKMCKDGADCLSAMCQAGRCATAPACNDGLKNGSETDVDCGGGKCNPCQNGRRCALNSDCVSNSCKSQVCAVVASCNDGLINQDETDVDCGGNICPKCAANKKCLFGSDCQSNLCSGGLCKAAQKANVGSYDPYLQGPNWQGNPTVYSCVEACAMLFGGAANQYGCSTQANVLDNKAYVDGYADPVYCTTPTADTYKKGATYDCGVMGCAYSAWVSDNPACDKKNYCWK